MHLELKEPLDFRVKYVFIYQFFNMRSQSKENTSLKKTTSDKKTSLPFVVHRAPIENHIAYEKKGHWTSKEKLKYVIFLEYFKQKFTSRDKKKRFCRIFKVMSDFIKTRTHNQCRSHHQKMEKQRFQVDSIIKNVVQKYHPRVYKELYDRYLIQIENLRVQQQQEQYNQRKKQNQMVSSSQPYMEKSKLERRNKVIQNQKTQNPKEKIEIQQTINPKKQECDQMIFQKPSLQKKYLRLTEQCSDSQSEEPKQHKEFGFDEQRDFGFEFPPRANMYFQNSQNPEFERNSFGGCKANLCNNISGNFQGYIENLQMRKLACLNRATYHYNQMQQELKNVAECEREKQMMLQRQNQKITGENYFNFGFPSFSWGFQSFQK